MAVDRSGSGRAGTPVLLVTGGTGQIGFELIRALTPLGMVLAPTRADLDLAQPASIRELVRRTRPDVIVNAGAYTAVDKAESDREACFAVNATAPRILAEEAHRLGATIIHYSTDYVFDGAKREPYVETDEPGPLNVYGESKLAGERAVADVGGAWLVVRTSWVYGMRGHNFLRTMLKLAREREELRVVDDQIGAPTWSRTIARATAQIVADFGEHGNDISGVYHMTASGSTSWCGFARELLEADPRRDQQICRRVVGIPSDGYPTPAQRPRWSVLSNEKLRRRLGLRLESWETQLARALSDGGE